MIHINFFIQIINIFLILKQYINTLFCYTCKLIIPILCIIDIILIDILCKLPLNVYFIYRYNSY